MRYALLISMLIAGLSRPVLSQSAHKSYQAGEHIQYRAVYNWGVLWLNAGIVEFYVRETEYESKPALAFVSLGRSYPTYDWFFKVRDTFKSVVALDEQKPLYFTRKTYEGGYEVDNWVKYKHAEGVAIAKTENSDEAPAIDTLPMPGNLYDVISGVYRTRNISFEKCKIDDTIPVKMIIDGAVEDLYIRYLGKEKLETRDGRIFNTIKFSALLVEGTIFKGGEDLTVWITDDKNRIPVLVEAKILIGNVKAMLVDATGLKYPLEAEIIK